jgi:hypothetical protein
MRLETGQTARDIQTGEVVMNVYFRFQPREWEDFCHDIKTNGKVDEDKFKRAFLTVLTSAMQTLVCRPTEAQVRLIAPVIKANGT